MSATTPTAENIEFRIRDLLTRSSTLEAVTQTLFQEFADPEMSREAFEILSVFAMSAGQQLELNKFLLQLLTQKVQIPWGHFCESIFKSCSSVPISFKKALVEGATAQRSLNELARSRYLDSFDESLLTRFENRSSLIKEKIEKIRAELLNTAEVLRTQGLLEEEERILARLSSFFPQDVSIQNAMAKQRAQIKKAKPAPREVVRQRRTGSAFSKFEKMDAEQIRLLGNIFEAMQRHLFEKMDPALNTRMREDFAIAHVFFENYQGALSFFPNELGSRPPWLKFEIWLLQKNYSEILISCNDWMESQGLVSSDILALNYFRAKALWGLHQDELAIEILETLIESHPNYRDMTTLLAEWKVEAR